jgi:MSHA pilin protein MshD
MTLIELIMFIIIVSVGLAGLLSALNVTVSHSADPMLRKQMLSIAEALLEEVELQPFTYCDLTDDNAANATTSVLDGTHTDATKCWRAVESLGAANEQWNGTALSNQSRTSATAPFNSVTDYHGLSLPSPITDINGSAAAPAGYTASITIVPTDTLGGVASSTCASGTDCTAMKLVRIVVTVNSPSDSLTLEGYRFRYWPNDLSW